MLEHQNTSTRTRSGIRDEGEREGTLERALVGTFWCLGCGGRVGSGGCVGGWGTGWRVGDRLDKWWEARGGTSVRFLWRERLGLGESVS